MTTTQSPLSCRIVCSCDINISIERSNGESNGIIISLTHDESKPYTINVNGSCISIDSTTSSRIDAAISTKSSLLVVHGIGIYNSDMIDDRKIVEAVMLTNRSKLSSNKGYYNWSGVDVFPYSLIDDDMIWTYQSYDKTDDHMIVTDGEYFPTNHIKSSFMAHEHKKYSLYEKLDRIIYINELNNDVLEAYINELIIDTGVIMAGSYPLYHVLVSRKYDIVDNWKPNDVNIFGYTLEFLRKLIHYCLLNDILFRVKLDRYDNDMDLYYLYIGEVCINYIHIGGKDTDKSKLHQKAIIEFILTRSDIDAAATYYDGEIVYHDMDQYFSCRYDPNTYKFRGPRYKKYVSRGFDDSYALKSDSDSDYSSE